MSGWHQIRAARTDMTDYVVHLTRCWVDLEDGRKAYRDSFKRLKEIVRTGCLKPTYAPRVTVQKNCNRTIRGPHPAVCFTAQPLAQIPVTLNSLSGTMYQGYGIALHKVDLHNYGGRPVIYGDSDTFNDLSDERKYLWVRYRPIRPDDHGYPNDFTWEREWRCRMQDGELTPWEHSLQGVPILLPDDFRRVAKKVGPRNWKMTDRRSPSFRIIVQSDAEAKELRSYIDGLWIKPKVRGYYTVYVSAVKRAQIISLEHAKRRLKVGDTHYGRIEDLTPPEKRLNFIPFPKPIMVKRQRSEEKLS